MTYCILGTRMSTLPKSRISDYYTARKNLVDTKLSELLTSSDYRDNGTFTEALKYTILLDGKRIRPVFALAIFELFSKDITKILEPACAIELLHAGSLMLDDLPSMDNAHLRRGEKTSHTKFGESTTILASAALWVESFDLVAKIYHPRSQELLSETTKLVGSRGLILGQYYDLEAKNRTYTIDVLTQHYELKTAAMFRLAAKFAAVLGQANKSQEMYLDEYARCLGIAFQIKDDIIDSTSSVESSGKDPHLDHINHKQNFINTIGMEESKKALDDYIAKANAALRSTNLSTKNLISVTKNLL